MISRLTAGDVTGRGVVVQPGKHPQDVAVHRRHRQPKPDGGNGPGRVFADAGQSQQSIIVGGKLAPVLLTDQLCRPVQVAHPAVIAQPLPELVQLFLRAGGQRRDVRQLLDEPLVVGQRRRHPCLLQHDLTDPDMVGGGVLPEGQHPAAAVEPVQQRRGDGGQLRR